MHPIYPMSKHFKTCFCENCVHGASDDYLNVGSRIDKLYYNKYLPLREKKLLDKLVRTRAIYDDIRQRIISGSSIDIYSDGNRTGRRNNEWEQDRGSEAIHKLVSLVDKGQIPTLRSNVNLHTRCCSCCDCSPRIHTGRHPKVHQHIPSHEHVNQYLKEHEKKVPKKKRGVTYGVIKSDSCMCVLNWKKVKTILKTNERKDINSHNKVKQTQKEYKKPRTNSITKLKNASNKIRESIRSSVTSIEHVFHIKKDSIALFREKLQKKQAMQEWTCDPNFCVRDNCIPEECYEKIKMRKLRRNKKLGKSTSKSRSTITHDSSKIKEKRRKSKSPTSKLGVIICKCKIRTKSPPSTTEGTIAKKTVKKSRRKRASKFSGVGLTSIPRSRLILKKRHQNFSQDKTFYISPFTKTIFTENSNPYQLKRCFCTLQLKKYPKHSSTRSSRVSFHKRPALLSKSSVTKNKVKRRNVKSEFGVLYSSKHSTKTQVDKQEPINVIQPASAIAYARTHSLLSINNEEKLLTKEKKVNIAPKRPKITSISVTKSPPKNIRSRVPKHRKRSIKTKHAELPFAAKSKSSPNAPRRQVARISSSFRFDIEFFKDKNFPDQIDNVKANNNVHTPIKKSNVSINDKKEDNRTYESINNVSKSILEPFLKKCLCNLILNKPIKYKIKHSSKLSMTDSEVKRNIITDTSEYLMPTAVVNTAVIPPQTFANLLPYECEPNFCTPGQCDPYNCLKRIKMRNQIANTSAKETGTICSHCSQSTSTIEGSSTRSAATYPERTRDRPRKKHGTQAYEPKQRYSSSSVVSRGRQAVKIGSSFKFDIEFYKTTTAGAAESTPAPPRREPKPKPVKTHGKGQQKEYERAPVKAKGVGKSPQQNDRMSYTSNDVRSRPVGTDPFLKRCFCTLKLQKDPYRRTKGATTSDLEKYAAGPGGQPMHTQTKKYSDETFTNPMQAGGLLPYECEPGYCVPGQCDPYVCLERIKNRNLLKRCFCTLKFFKPNTKDKAEDAPGQAIRTIDTQTAKMKPLKQKLLPYECEPGVCVPYQCDPIECKKLIDARNAKFQTRHAGTDKPRRKSEFVHTQRRHGRHRESQSSFSPPQGRDGQTETARKKKYDRRPTETTISPIESTHGRQAVRLSSAMSFDIEFYRNKAAAAPQIEYRTVVEPKKKAKVKDNQAQGFTISKERGMRTGGRRASATSQADHSPQTMDRYAVTDTKLQRCFCTLKFHKKGRNQNYQANYVYGVDHTSPFLQDSRIICPRVCRPSLCLPDSV